MDAQTLIIKRTGMSSEDAAFYEEYAETAIRAKLNMEDGADLSKYLFQIVDLAVLYWQRDTATQNSSASLGYESVSHSEGSVSESVKSMQGSVLYSTYNDAINDLLNGLDNPNGMVRFL